MADFIKKAMGLTQRIIAIGLTPVMLVAVLVGFSAGLVFGALRAGFQDGSL
jgi:hypothetical protein